MDNNLKEIDSTQIIRLVKKKKCLSDEVLLHELITTSF